MFNILASMATLLCALPAGFLLSRRLKLSGPPAYGAAALFAGLTRLLRLVACAGMLLAMLVAGAGLLATVSVLSLPGGGLVGLALGAMVGFARRR